MKDIAQKQHTLIHEHITNLLTLTLEEYNKCRELISLCYIEGNERSYQYHFSNVEVYIRDYIYAGIDVADHFLKKAIAENPKEFMSIRNKCSPFTNDDIDLRKCGNEPHKRFKQMFKWLNELPSRYIASENDPDKIVYNIQDTASYVNCWLYGVTTAEPYIIGTMEEDILQLKKVMANLAGDDKIKLVELMLRHTDKMDAILQRETDKEKINFLITLKLRQQITEALTKPAKTSVVISSKLALADKKGLLQDLFNTQLDICQVLSHLDNPELLIKIWTMFEKTLNKDFLTFRIFLNALSPDFYQEKEMYIKNLKELQKYFKTKISVGDKISSVLKDVFQATKDIYVDYYIASLSEDASQMLAVAKDGNNAFISCFYHEIAQAYNGDYKDPSFLDRRVEFLENVLLMPELHKHLQEFIPFNELKRRYNEKFGNYLLPENKTLEEKEDNTNSNKITATASTSRRNNNTQTATSGFGFFDELVIEKDGPTKEMQEFKGKEKVEEEQDEFETMEFI